MIKLEKDNNFRSLFTEAEPVEILKLAQQHGFVFSKEIRGRFLNRWAGVYSCPFAIDIGRLCPKLVPQGYRNLLHYSQSTCSRFDKEERYDFRSGNYYADLTT
ncbi:Nif11 family protein [cyanobiont of Ornithocercus magnificus]|nr:Nif11 family protein [cyanobiont of Ornithocercus magnificus]